MNVQAEELLSPMSTWVKENPEQVVELVAQDFNIDGEQEALRARAKRIEWAVLDETSGAGEALVVFDVLYANPAFEEDYEMSATNVAEHPTRLAFKLDLSDWSLEDLRLLPDEAPSD